MTTITRFTKEQLIDQAKTRMEANRYLLTRLSPESATVKEVAMNLAIDEIALASLDAGNSPVIPDGYALVPIEPTESMIVSGFESRLDEDFSEPEAWEGYQAMSGCQQAAHRAKLCWAAMIAAAPQHGEKS